MLPKILHHQTLLTGVHSYKKGRDPMIIRATLIKRKNRYSNFHKRLWWEDLPRGGASGKWHWQVWGRHDQKYLLFCWNSKNSKWFPFKRWRFNFIWVHLASCYRLMTATWNDNSFCWKWYENKVTGKSQDTDLWENIGKVIKIVVTLGFWFQDCCFQSLVWRPFSCSFSTVFI